MRRPDVAKRRRYLALALLWSALPVAVCGGVLMWATYQPGSQTSALDELVRLPSYVGASGVTTDAERSPGTTPGSKALLTFRTTDEPPGVQAFYKNVFLGKGWHSVAASHDFQASYADERQRLKGLVLDVGQSGRGLQFGVSVTSAWRTVTVSAIKVHTDVYDMSQEITSVSVEYELLNP